MEAGQGSKDNLKHDRCQSNQSCDGAARKVNPKAPGCNAQWEMSGEKYWCCVSIDNEPYLFNCAQCIKEQALKNS